jgi:hypothetical protein
MQAWSFHDLRGHIGPTIVTGRAPTRDTEAALGSLSLRRLHKSIGDRIRVVGATNDPHELTVVGTGLFPNSDSDDIATGVITTAPTFDAIANTSDPDEAPRRGVAFRWKPDANVAAFTEELAAKNVDISPGGLPPDIANMRGVRAYPWWLAAFLVVLAMLATMNALIVSSRRRRHEMAVLGAIGLSRTQLTGAAAIQGSVVGLGAAIVGVPLGLLVGKWVWTVHADRIGLGTSLTFPFGAGVVVAAVTVGFTAVIAVAAGWGALRTRLATALHTE